MVSMELILFWYLSVLSASFAGAATPRAREAGTPPPISVPQALAIFIEEGLYDLCAAFLQKPVYGRTSTQFTTVTSSSIVSVTTTAANEKTVKEGTVTKTVTILKTTSVTDYFYTETVDYYSFNFKTITTRTTAVGTTTLYTYKVKRRDEQDVVQRRALAFPSGLSKYPEIISCACSSLLDNHTKTVISTKTSTSTLTSTATATPTTTVPANTLTKKKAETSTFTQELIDEVTILFTPTVTVTNTKVIYTKTTTVSSQCAPTAYVGNAQEYSDSADINFDLTVPDQANTIACCELCVNRPDCQAWIFYSQEVAYGRCQFVTGSTLGVCPPPTYNSGFLPPVCYAHVGSGVDIGLGSCMSDISLTNPTSPEGCVLGEN